MPKSTATKRAGSTIVATQIAKRSKKSDRIFIHAMRDIKPGEELSYDYALEIDEPITRKSRKLYECFCGSPDCRGTMLEL
jgi:SET domain-containing protein